MDRRLVGALSIGSLVALLALGWSVRPALAPEPVPVSAPVPAKSKPPTQPTPPEHTEHTEPAPNPWAIEAPEPPDRPSAEPGTWEERRLEAHEAWRARSIEAVEALAERWTEVERQAVLDATTTMIDTVGRLRADVESGRSTPAELRAGNDAARDEADRAIRAAVPDHADAVWAALNAASTPL